MRPSNITDPVNCFHDYNTGPFTNGIVITSARRKSKVKAKLGYIIVRSEG